VKSPNQHVNTHTANTHNPKLHFSSYPHSFDIQSEGMFVKKV